MYIYHPPTPIIIKLADELGFSLREKAAKYIKENNQITDKEYRKATKIMTEETYSGI